MRRNLPAIRWFIPVFAFAALASYGGIFSHFREAGAQREETFRVLEVIDGDTIAVADRNGHRRFLRYQSIDCPEHQREDSPGDPFSEKATELNAKLVGNGTVRVRFGNERYDRYGRLLGFVFSGKVNINTELVASGLATVLEIGPQSGELIEELRRAQTLAMKNRIGIWEGNGVFEPPENHEKFVVNQSKVADMAGKRIVTRAKITGSVAKRNGIVILKTDGGVEIVIFGKAVTNFRHFGINPLEHYTGKTVQVVGRASMYRGSPNIIINHPISIYAQR